jgi:hypothetical protein
MRKETHLEQPKEQVHQEMRRQGGRAARDEAAGPHGGKRWGGRR